MVEGWCMKCKAKREMMGVEHVKMKNGRPAMKGKCKSCDTKMFKIGSGASSGTSSSKKSKKGGVSRKSKKSKKTSKKKSKKSKKTSKRRSKKSKVVSLY